MGNSLVATAAQPRRTGCHPMRSTVNFDTSCFRRLHDFAKHFLKGREGLDTGFDPPSKFAELLQARRLD